MIIYIPNPSLMKHLSMANEKKGLLSTRGNARNDEK